jgi:hypothetical protein
MIEQQPEPLERRQRLSATFLRQASGVVETGPEARKHFFIEDGRGDPRGTGIDDQTNRIRSDVDDR